MKIFLIIVAAIFVSVCLIRGALAFSGQSLDPNKKNEVQQEYRLVPCEDYPNAIGC